MALPFVLLLLFAYYLLHGCVFVRPPRAGGSMLLPFVSRLGKSNRGEKDVIANAFAGRCFVRYRVRSCKARQPSAARSTLVKAINQSSISAPKFVIHGLLLLQ